MFAQQLDLHDGLIKISNQSTGQLYMVEKASNSVATFLGQHHSFRSFSGSARGVVVLGMLHLVIIVVSQDGQSFLCSISHSSIECPLQYGSLDHLADTVDAIGHRPIIDDHTYVPWVSVPSRQPQGSDKK
jgi:hypothetical protein